MRIMSCLLLWLTAAGHAQDKPPIWPDLARAWTAPISQPTGSAVSLQRTFDRALHRIVKLTFRVESAKDAERTVDETKLEIVLLTEEPRGRGRVTFRAWMSVVGASKDGNDITAATKKRYGRLACSGEFDSQRGIQATSLGFYDISRRQENPEHASLLRTVLLLMFSPWTRAEARVGEVWKLNPKGLPSGFSLVSPYRAYQSIAAKDTVAGQRCVRVETAYDARGPNKGAIESQRGQWTAWLTPDGITPRIECEFLETRIGTDERLGNRITIQAEIATRKRRVPVTALAADWITSQQYLSKAGGWKSNSGSDYDVAATAVALMSLLGEGAGTGDDRPFSAIFKKGLHALIQSQSDDGGFRAPDRKFNVGIRDASFVVLALAWLQRTDPTDETKNRVERAVRHIQDTWSKKKRDRDDEDAGWVLFAVHEARLVDVKVDEKAEAATRNWLFTRPKLFEARHRDDQGVLTRAAMVVLAHLWSNPTLDGAPEVVGKALRFLRENRPSDKFDMHGWYLGFAAMFRSGDPAFRDWSDSIHHFVVKRQDVLGKLRGSWDAVGRRTGESGRVFTTGLMALLTQIYYRYDNTPGVIEKPRRRR